MSNNTEESIITKIGLLNDILVVGYENTITRLLSEEDKTFIQEFQHATTDHIEQKIDALKEQLYKL